MKKILSLLLAVTLLFSLGTTAVFAADNGSITVTNATVGESYAVYKVFDLTYSGENVAYTYPKNGGNETFLNALTGDESPFTLALVGTAYNVFLKDGKTAEDITTFLTAQKDNLTQSGDTKEATSDTVTFTGLSYGYYYITSTLGGTVTIDSTTPHVDVVDKNQGPTWDNGDGNPGKVIIDANGNKVSESTANYGDTVNFSVAINATAYVGDKEVTYYYITDTLEAGFDAAKDIEVYVNDEKLDSTKYTLAENGNTFQVTIPYSAADYGANSKIEVRYSATVLNSALLAGVGNKNAANFTYDTKTPGTTTPDPAPNPTYPDNTVKTTSTYVYALGIVKVDPQGNVLAGAEFSVKDANGDAVYATGDNGVYEYCDSSAEGAVKQFTTDNNGVLVIKGVAAGKYSLTEEVAPAGYNVLKDAKDIEAVLKASYSSTITTYIDADGNVTDTVTADTKTYDAGANVVGLVVVNQSGTELPSTGGIGTTIFYVLGGLLVAGAVILLVTKKRMSINA